MFTFIDMGLTLLAIGAAVYLVYLLLYSRQEARRQQAKKSRRIQRLDRREQERQDRRKSKAVRPATGERRTKQPPRRSGD